MLPKIYHCYTGIGLFCHADNMYISHGNMRQNLKKIRNQQIFRLMSYAFKSSKSVFDYVSEKVKVNDFNSYWLL